MEIFKIIVWFMLGTWLLFSMIKRCETFSDYLTFAGSTIVFISIGIMLSPTDTIILPELWTTMGLAAGAVFVYASIEIESEN